MALAAFLMQPDPAAAPLGVVVLNPHLYDRTDAAKSVDHGGNKGPIAQTNDGRGIDGLEELAPSASTSPRGRSALNLPLQADPT